MTVQRVALVKQLISEATLPLGILKAVGDYVRCTILFRTTGGLQILSLGPMLVTFMQQTYTYSLTWKFCILDILT